MQDLLKKIDQEGYAVYRKSEPTFASTIANQLGQVFSEADIVINYDKKQLLYSDKAMPLHHDHPNAKYIIWKCIRQSNEGGLSLLLDFDKVFKQLDVEERLLLEAVFCKVPSRTKMKPEVKPVVSYLENGKAVYYFAPWLLVEPNLQSHQKVVDKLRQIIRDTPLVKVRLLPDDVLIVDNTRMLHSRGPILGNKDRLLKRYWISVQAQSQAFI